VPLKLGYPKADIPTLQLSLRKGLDPREHLAMGRALAPLRDRGVFLIGSGMSYHNMRGLMTAARGAGAAAQRASDDSKAFDEWLQQTVALDADKRDTRLTEWESAPAARASHPREEHLLPLHVIAGAAGEQRGTVPYRDHVMGVHICGVHFG
jgi:aromatic ring-opening dioxygenase catalytic subunit (LigB family)